MTKHGMRGFASGIIATTAVVALFYFQLEPKTDAAADNKPLTEKTVQSYLNSHNEIAVDKEMFDKWQNSQKDNAKSDKTADNSKKTDDQSSSSDTSAKDNTTTDTTAKTDTPQVYKATVTVSDGMTTSEVASELAANHVIKDKYELINYVVNNKLEPYLQLGTYTLSSDMTIAQIASKITNH